VANLIADRMDPRDIGERLGINRKTVNVHCGMARAKFGVTDTTDLIRCILLKRLVDAVQNGAKRR
jgi:DNA-binding CsgD family transcriptional regulator